MSQQETTRQGVYELGFLPDGTPTGLLAHMCQDGPEPIEVVFTKVEEWKDKDVWVAKAECEDCGTHKQWRVVVDRGQCPAVLAD